MNYAASKHSDLEKDEEGFYIYLVQAGNRILTKPRGKKVLENIFDV